jgi:hypothetical protein
VKADSMHDPIRLAREFILHLSADRKPKIRQHYGEWQLLEEDNEWHFLEPMMLEGILSEFLKAQEQVVTPLVLETIVGSLPTAFGQLIAASEIVPVADVVPTPAKPSTPSRTIDDLLAEIGREWPMLHPEERTGIVLLVRAMRGKVRL